MKAHEMRIGNFITSAIPEFAEAKSVTYHEIRYAQMNPENNYLPILITDEWLDKFGFTNGEGMKFKDNEYFSIGKESSFPDTHLFFGNEPTGVYVKYVHELQNLYYALTQTELQIK